MVILIDTVCSLRMLPTAKPVQSSWLLITNPSATWIPFCDKDAHSVKRLTETFSSAPRFAPHRSKISVTYFFHHVYLNVLLVACSPCGRRRCWTYGFIWTCMTMQGYTNHFRFTFNILYTVIFECVPSYYLPTTWCPCRKFSQDAWEILWS